MSADMYKKSFYSYLSEEKLTGEEEAIKVLKNAMTISLIYLPCFLTGIVEISEIVGGNFA